MRFSVASGTDNSLLQLIANYTKPKSIVGLKTISKTFYGLNAPPHALTTRLTYTVPAGKIATINVIDLSVMRFVAPTVLTIAYAECQIAPVAGGATSIILNEYYDAAVGINKPKIITPDITILAGDVITYKTFDGSTDGTIDYTLSLVLTEQDI